MPDAIASFRLREATQEDLGIALGRAYREYSLWHGHSTIVANFVQDARAAGVKAIMADRNRAALDFAQAEGIIKGPKAVNDILIDEIANHPLATAHHRGQSAPLGMLHKGSETIPS